MKRKREKHNPEVVAEARRIFKADPKTRVKSVADKLGVSVQRVNAWVKDIREEAGVIKHYRVGMVSNDKVMRTCNLCKRKVLLPRYIFNCGCNLNLKVGSII